MVLDELTLSGHDPDMNKIREIRELRKMSQAKLARLAGTSQPQIDRLEKGLRKLDTVWMDRLAGALGVTAADLLANGSEKPASTPSLLQPNVTRAAAEPPDFYRLPKDVPVYGAAECGDGVFQMDEGQAIDWVRRPPGIAGNRSVFGIYLSGSSMEPALMSGDLVYLDPNRPAQTGRFIVLELRPKKAGDAPAAMLKVLVKRTSEYYELRQLNPDKTFRVKASDVLRTFRVLTNAELLGV